MRNVTASGILRLIVILLGIAGIVLFLIPVPLTGTVSIGTVTGLGIGLLLVAYGIWQKGIHRLAAAGWHHTAGRILEIVLLVIAAGILVLAAACSVAMISGASGNPEPGNTVIVLGARVYENRLSRAMKGRLDAALMYLEENPESACIVSGGQGKNETATEASVMYRYLTGQGISEDRIYMEDQSTDTEENLRYSKQILEKEQLEPRIVLATNDYHAYRAKHYARDIGLDADVILAPTTWWLWPTSVVREMYGILELWFLR